MEIGLAVRERLAASEATYAGRRTRALHVGVLGIGAFLLAAIFVLQVHDYTVVPDEIGYVKQAQHIWEAHALARPDFFYYYSVAQLLPLISAPIFGLLPIVTALKVAHLLYAALLASVVLPAYLLARSIRLPHYPALIAAGLCTITPWLTFSGTVMTEVVSLPAFMWAVYAMQRALVRPSVRRDLLVLVLIGVTAFARLQLGVLVLAYLAAIFLTAWAEPSGRRGALRRAVRGHGPLFVVLVAGAVVAVASYESGVSRGILGIYKDTINSSGFGLEGLRSGRDQLAFVVLAVGGAPAALAIAWAWRSLRRGAGLPEERAYAAITASTVVLMTLLAGAFGAVALTGERTIVARYLFYLAPLLLIGFVAYIRARPAGWRAPVVSGMAVALLALTVGASALGNAVDAPLVDNGTGTRVELGRALGIGFDPRPLLAVAALLATIAAVLVLRRLSRPVAMLIVVAPVAALLLGTTIYRMHSIVVQANGAANVPGEKDWIDDAVGPHASVAAVLGPVRSVDSLRTWSNYEFWNKSLRYVNVPRGGDTYGQGWVKPSSDTSNDPFVQLDVPYRYAVVSLTNLRYALGDAPVVARNGDTALIRVGPAGRIPLSWRVTGFTDQGLSVVPAWLQPLQALPTLQAPIGVKVFNGPRKVMTTVAVTAERAGPCPCLTSVGAGVPPQSPRPGGLPTTSSQTSPVPAGGVGYFPVMVIGNVRLTHISVRSR